MLRRQVGHLGRVLGHVLALAAATDRLLIEPSRDQGAATIGRGELPARWATGGLMVRVELADRRRIFASGWNQRLVLVDRRDVAVDRHLAGDLHGPPLYGVL